MTAATESATLLGVRLLPTCSCFISLPESYARSNLQHVNPNHGATILQLSWQNGNEFENVHVGWVGDISQGDDIEMSMEFAKCIHLTNAQGNLPGFCVGIRVVPFTPVATTIEMEPCTSDDWEIIQLHAGYLEGEILRQVCVIQNQQEIPIRIQQHIVVHLIAHLPPEQSFARLSSNSEVIIAPKERQAETNGDAEPFKFSFPLTVQPLNTNRTNSLCVLTPQDDEILIHPTTLQLLDGYDYADILYASVWEDSGKQIRKCVGRLVPSLDVVFGYIGLPHSIRYVLEITDLSRVRLQILNHSPLLPLRVNLTVLNASTNDFIIDRFVSTMQKFPSRLLSTRNLLALDDGTELLVDLVFQNPSAETQHDSVKAKDDDYVILGESYLPSHADVFLHKATDIPLMKQDKGEHSSLYGMEPVLDTLWKHVLPVLGRDACGVRTRMGVSPSGSILLHGSRGSGKTSLVNTLAKKCQLSHSTMCSSIVVSCRDLRGLKMDTVQSELKNSFDKAWQLAPCLLVFDDIDALMPPENDDGGMSSQSRRLAEHLTEHLKQLRYRMQQSTTQVSQTEITQENWQQFCIACTKQSVAVLATSREAQSMHPILRTCGLFDRPTSLSLPDVVAREKILRGLAASKVPNSDLSEDFQQAAYKTEGFSVRDLNQVVDRALHQATIQARGHQQNPIPMDLLHALNDFTPAALRGVELFKSTIEWSDIGGLKDIRQTLKDTLELPTKYGRLYGAAPIKLPSGLLLFGPPGCGKTLLASAVANECGLNFISVKGPEVLNKYIGASEQAVRDLFARAAAAAPSVLFLDEFDAMAPRRGADNTGVTDRVVNQLLTFLDGVESRQGVYVLAATSRPDMIDPALLRPGRLDKSLYCGFPDAAERLDILQAVGRKMDLADDVHPYLKIVAKQTELYSGADLQAVLYSAQLEAIHEALPKSDDWDVDFQDGSDSVSFSPKKPSSTKICTWHVQNALSSSRPTVSLEAKQRYDRMYGSFKNATAPRVTDFKTAESDQALDLTSDHPMQRSALY